MWLEVKHSYQMSCVLCGVTKLQAVLVTCAVLHHGAHTLDINFHHPQLRRVHSVP